ncbi:hypothetical protein BJ546DRAFT_1027209 [Cryomyces antarcticus]
MAAANIVILVTGANSGIGVELAAQSMAKGLRPPLAPPLHHQMRDAFDTNATGPAVVTIAFVPLLRKPCASPRIVDISSGIQYRASRAALDMVTACQWAEYGAAGIKVFAYDPGFTPSHLGPHDTAENGAKPASAAVMPLIDVLQGRRHNEAGKFLHNTAAYPW